MSAEHFSNRPESSTINFTLPDRLGEIDTPRESAKRVHKTVVLFENIQRPSDEIRVLRDEVEVLGVMENLVQVHDALGVVTTKTDTGIQNLTETASAAIDSEGRIPNRTDQKQARAGAMVALREAKGDIEAYQAQKSQITEKVTALNNVAHDIFGHMMAQDEATESPKNIKAKQVAMAAGAIAMPVMPVVQGLHIENPHVLEVENQHADIEVSNRDDEAVLILQKTNLDELAQSLVETARINGVHISPEVFDALEMHVVADETVLPDNPIEPIEFTVTGISSLNLRPTPGTEQPRVGGLTNGSNVRIVDSTDTGENYQGSTQWHRVQVLDTNGQVVEEGWVTDVLFDLTDEVAQQAQEYASYQAIPDLYNDNEVAQVSASDTVIPFVENSGGSFLVEGLSQEARETAIARFEGVRTALTRALEVQGITDTEIFSVTQGTHTHIAYRENSEGGYTIFWPSVDGAYEVNPALVNEGVVFEEINVPGFGVSSDENGHPHVYALLDGQPLAVFDAATGEFRVAPQAPEGVTEENFRSLLDGTESFESLGIEAIARPVEMGLAEYQAMSQEQLAEIANNALRVENRNIGLVPMNFALVESNSYGGHNVTIFPILLSALRESETTLDERTFQAWKGLFLMQDGSGSYYPTEITFGVEEVLVPTIQTGQNIIQTQILEGEIRPLRISTVAERLQPGTQYSISFVALTDAEIENFSSGDISDEFRNMYAIYDEFNENGRQIVANNNSVGNGFRRLSSVSPAYGPISRITIPTEGRENFQANNQ